MAPTRLTEARLAIYKFFAGTLHLSVFDGDVQPQEETCKGFRFQIPVDGVESILLHKYRVPLGNTYFTSRREGLQFLQNLSYDKYLTVKAFIQQLSDDEGLYKWSKQCKIDTFLMSALRMQDIGTETGHSPSLLMESNAEDNRRDRLIQFRDIYKELIERVERWPVTSDPGLDPIENEKEYQARADDMCIYDCYPDDIITT
ncbi:hypothetical protein TWF281_008795 [Arthrobotrys megalospora]